MNVTPGVGVTPGGRTPLVAGDDADGCRVGEGPGPEGRGLGRIACLPYVVVGLECSDGIAAHDVTAPRQARRGYRVSPCDRTGHLEADGPDPGPAGLVRVDGPGPPTPRPLLLVDDEVSGTTTVPEVTGR